MPQKQPKQIPKAQKLEAPYSDELESRPGVSSHGLQAKFCSPSIFVNKTLLGYSHVHFFFFKWTTYGCFYATKVELSSCDGDCISLWSGQLPFFKLCRSLGFVFQTEERGKSLAHAGSQAQTRGGYH